MNPPDAKKSGVVQTTPLATLDTSDQQYYLDSSHEIG